MASAKSTAHFLSLAMTYLNELTSEFSVSMNLLVDVMPLFLEF